MGEGETSFKKTFGGCMGISFAIAVVGLLFIGGCFMLAGFGTAMHYKATESTPSSAPAQPEH